MIELASLVSRHARYRGDADAIVFEDRRFTWREFGARVAQVGHLLRQQGVGRGDKVATLSGNSLELLEVYWAVPTIGAVLVPLSPLLLSGGVASLVRGSQARCLVVEASLLPSVEPVLDGLGVRTIVIGDHPGRHVDYAVASASLPTTMQPASVDDETLFNIMFTSGTTGEPKGIMHSHRVRAMYGSLMAAALRMTPESRTLHTGAIVFNGAFVTMMPTVFLGAAYFLHRQFDPRRVVETVASERITHMMMVPTQIAALLSAPGLDPSRLASLECILSLGSPLLQRDKDRLNALLPGRLYELYGLTEGFITLLDREDAARKSGSVGVPPPLSAVRILRDDGTEAAPREIGEIVGRGPIMMSGYFNRPDLTAQTVREGWIHSGDLGWLDEDGFLYLVDRKKDMIDSGGVKIYPRDIEEIAAHHPEVSEVAVFGVPHEKWGETPLAAVVLRAGSTADPEALRDWINERVAARYQRVSSVVVMGEFPHNAAGKILKRELREPYWTKVGRQI